MSSSLARPAAVMALAAIAIVVAVSIARTSSSTSEPELEAAVVAAPTETPARPVATPTPVPVLGVAPDLQEIQGWLNTDLASLSAIQESSTVTVVQFWTFGCFNCKNTIPHLQALYAKYRDSGLEIVGVHSPEFSYEADPDNVAAAVTDLGVTWPVALDPEKLNFRSWQTGGRRFWPRIYVLDSAGNIRFDHIGEGSYDELDETVAQLLTDAA